MADVSSIVSCERYIDAQLYCQFYEQDGKRDWRLPTDREIDIWLKATSGLDYQVYWADTDVDIAPQRWKVIPIRDIPNESI